METVLIFVGLLLLSVMCEPVANTLKIPFSALLIIIGFAGSELLVKLGVDTGFRWHHFNYLILHVFVPILVFESAFNMNARALFARLFPILLLAIPGMILATFITGFLLYLGINHEAGFPLTTALLCAAILCATDPAAVVALFKKLGVSDDLTALLEGESLFNDATAVVLFGLLVTLASAEAHTDIAPEIAVGQSISFLGNAFLFIYVFVLGSLVGAAFGFVFSKLAMINTGAIQFVVLSVIAGFMSFYLAEHWLDASGIMSVLVCGLILGKDKNTAQDNSEFSKQFWQLAAYGCNGILFILVGVTITVGMFTSHWLAMLIGIGAATFSRFVILFVLLPGCTFWLPQHHKVSTPYKQVMMWGGLRGAVSLALALAIPIHIEGWYSIQSIVYGYVLFTLLVQGPLIPLLLKRYAHQLECQASADNKKHS